MRKFLILFFLCVLFTGIIYAQDTISSQIEEVILFYDQALVTRKAKVEVKEGLNELIFEIEAFSIDKDSIQAVIYGNGELYSVQLKETHTKDVSQKKIKDLTDKIEKLKDQRKILKDEAKVLNKKNKFLDSIIEFSKTQVPKDLKTNFPKTDDLQKTLEFLGNSYRNIDSGLENLRIEIRNLDKEIVVLEGELTSIKKPFRKTKKIIEILFNSEKKQNVKAEITYLAYNAFWQPIYKVDVPLDLKDINLTMFSKMKQVTGEDWHDINLAISNVIPLKGVSLPSGNSWFLNIYNYKKKRESYERGLNDFVGGNRAPATLDAEDKEFELDEAVPQAARFSQAIRKKLPLSFEYQLPQNIDIESKDKETILPILSKSITGEIFHYAVPKTSPLAFLVCKAKADREILAGPLNVYLGGRFIGKTYLNEKKAGEEFNLGLGADREVKVKREKIKDKVKETFFQKIKRQTVIREISIKITAENLKQKAIKIKILDAIPVSKTDRIEVKDIKITPQPKKKNYQDKEGLNLWEFSLTPKEKKEIKIDFTLTYPIDAPISNL